jgi:hypothetical protein
MAGFGEFAPFGLLSFGSTETSATALYASMTNNQVGSFLLDTHVAAGLYAKALALAAVRATLRHGFDQRRPLRSVELLPALERNYGVVPLPSDSEEVRRREVASRKLIGRGPRRESLENALRMLLGSDFVGLHTQPSGVTGEGKGAWDAPTSVPRMFRMTTAISSLGTPASFVYENLFADGSRMRPGERYSVQPENLANAESITVVSAASSGALTATAIFARPHDIGAIVRTHAPTWISWRRAMLVVLTASAASNPLIRRKVDQLMRRMVRGTTVWAIVEASSPSTAGPFTVGVSRIGLVPIGTVTF